MARKALHDANGVLLEHGFVDYTAQGGQIVREVAEDFDEKPLVRRWNGTAYEDYAPPSATADEHEQACKDFLNGAITIQPYFNLRRAFVAKAISDEAYRLGKAPGALTGAELSALRARIAAIYKAL